MPQPRHLFLAGVPATGKTWLGVWLAEHCGFGHIDAEKNRGADFDRFGLHDTWNELIATGSATRFVEAARELDQPVVVNWGFPVCYLYVVSALLAEGVAAWWLHGERDQARRAFVMRGGIDPAYFEKQMDDIQREWHLLSAVFGKRIVRGLGQDGSQRHPQEIWAEISRGGNASILTVCPDGPRTSGPS